MCVLSAIASGSIPDEIAGGQPYGSVAESGLCRAARLGARRADVSWLVGWFAAAVYLLVMRGAARAGVAGGAVVAGTRLG